MEGPGPAALFRQYICRACGYIYDEAVGDPDGGLAAGTRYADIPDQWMCPICGVGKADFEPFSALQSAPTGVARTPVADGRTRRGNRTPLVIVGAGVAGWAVAHALRAHDADLPITLVTCCSGAVYLKPMLSVALAQGRTAAMIAGESGMEAARRLGVRLMSETWAVSLDARQRRLRTSRGPLTYSKLVLALGATPAPLPLDAASSRLVWRINHLDHYARFRKALGAAPKTVAVIGAGLVGCELADDLVGSGHTVTVIDIGPRPLANLAAPAVASAFVEALARAGVRWRLGTRVHSIARAGSAMTLDLGDEVLRAELVVAATGLRTDDRLARSAGLSFDAGYAVDPTTMQCSDPDIFALGDRASFGGKTCRFIEPIFPQARTIAAIALGKESPDHPIGTTSVRLKSRTMPLTLALAA